MKQKLKLFMDLEVGFLVELKNEKFDDEDEEGYKKMKRFNL